MMEWKTKQLFGLSFFNGSIAEAVKLISSASEGNLPDDSLPLVITPNLDILVQLNRIRTRNPFLWKQLRKSRFVFADGFPVLVASRLLKKSISNVVSGADLLPQLIAATTSRRYLFIGPDEKTLQILSQKFEKETDHSMAWIAPPIMKIASGKYDENVQQTVQKVRSFRPDFAIVGLGFPKQEQFSLAVLEQLGESDPKPLFMGFGASAEFLAGTKSRAPQWMRRMKLEWFHRLLHEPKRLLIRYIKGALLFIPVVAQEFCRQHHSDSENNGSGNI